MSDTPQKFPIAMGDGVQVLFATFAGDQQRGVKALGRLLVLLVRDDSPDCPHGVRLVTAPATNNAIARQCLTDRFLVPQPASVAVIAAATDMETYFRTMKGK